MQDGSCAKECPFYVKGADNLFGCLLKTIVNKESWNNILENELSDEFEEEYSSDCEGKFQKCSFANEIWNGSEIEEVMNDVEEIEEENDSDTDVKITIHQVKNPYQIKCDVLVYPTNNLLEIKDPALNRMSRNKIQAECDQYQKNNPVKMGHIYKTSNGGGSVVAKNIYHAVVSGESLLVNDGDVANSIRKALILADNDEAEIVALIPPDIGKYNPIIKSNEYYSYESAAQAQLNTLAQYLMNIGVDSIKHILILTENELAYNIYVDQFSRTFNDEN